MGRCHKQAFTLAALCYRSLKTHTSNKAIEIIWFDFVFKNQVSSCPETQEISTVDDKQAATGLLCLHQKHK